MPVFIPFLAAGIVAAEIYNRHVIRQENERREAEEERRRNDRRRQWITFVGPTSSGKSSIASIMREIERLPKDDNPNPFIVGAGHGSTEYVTKGRYKNGWMLVDTPGIHDGEILAQRAFDVARKSSIIVLCLDAQMYRKTIEWTAGVLNSIGHSNSVVVIPYLGKLDLRERMMTVADRHKVTDSVVDQIKSLKNLIYKPNVKIGSLIEGSQEDIKPLVSLINITMEIQ